MAGSFFDKLFGRKPDADNTVPPPDQPEPPSRLDPAAYDKALGETHAAMDRHWAKVGQVESDVIAHLISPNFLGGPPWPTTRQAYRVVRRPGSIILATDGMSDPFEDDDEENGFGIELFIETADIPVEVAGLPGDVGGLKYSWAFEVLLNIAATVADYGGIRAPLDEYGSLSMESPGVSQARAIHGAVPAQFVSPEDTLGVLVGAPKPNFHDVVKDTPFRPVLLTPIVLLTAAELAFVRSGGVEARRTVADRLADSPSGHRSSLTRPSVV